MIFVRPAVRNDAGALMILSMVACELTWWFFVIFFSVPVLLELFGFLPEDAPIKSAKDDIGAGFQQLGAWASAKLTANWLALVAVGATAAVAIASGRAYHWFRGGF